MTTPTSMNWEVLTTAVKEGVLLAYQPASLLGLFPSVPIPKGIAAEKWAQKYIIETKRAGVHARGFNPNTITMDFAGFEVTPCTVDQKCVLNEIDQAQFAESGMLAEIVPQIGRNMAVTTNTWIMRHIGGNGEAAFLTEYHYILADGSGNGTAARPNWLYDASTTGVWSTWSNIQTDIAQLKGNFIAKGGNLASALVLIPKCAAPHMIRSRSEYQGKSVENYLADQGLRFLYVEDEYFWTQAGAVPTAALFDMVLIDVAEFVIGYQRPEQVVAGPGTFPDRNYYVEGEVWFALLCVPFRKNEGGTIKTYKSAARVKAIAQ